ncbi:unnamed protein product [Ilex paraguariensis]|uniref:Uncharacterized protein n=1 Tax=Ilex paraguariensis TaxID=185542 RepID=A0ABC8T8E4_9AQUA
MMLENMPWANFCTSKFHSFAACSESRLGSTHPSQLWLSLKADPPNKFYHAHLRETMKRAADFLYVSRCVTMFGSEEKQSSFLFLLFRPQGDSVVCPNPIKLLSA